MIEECRSLSCAKQAWVPHHARLLANSIWQTLVATTLLLCLVVGCGPSERETILDYSGDVAEIPGLRYDGLYAGQIQSRGAETEYEYLRFYPNHSVIKVAVPGPNAASDVQKWLSKKFAKENEGVAVGKVYLRNNRLWFSAVSSANTGDYLGEIGADGIDFQVDYHSHGSGHSFYSFYKSTADNPANSQANERAVSKPIPIGTLGTQATNLGQEAGTMTKNVRLGAFAVNVPSEWAEFAPNEAASLQRQYVAQSQQIYKQYSGSEDSAKSVDIAGFHIGNDAGAFMLVSLTVPEQVDLISLLKNQVDQKMDWGVRGGYIRKYLGLVPIDSDNFSGFYTKAIGKDGGVEVSGGLEAKKFKNTVIQLTLLCPQTWDERTATNALTTILASLVLTPR
jgi:hypothetical protein